MNIKSIPWYDRPGARLTREGVSKLTNADLLSIILGKSKKGSVLRLSNKLLSKYNLHRLEELGVKGLKKECNGDVIPALKILSFIELSKRYSKLVKGGYNHKVIACANDIYDRFADEMRSYKKEVLKVVLLDTKNRVINNKEVSVGTLNSSLVHPREIFKEAIVNSANSIILVHNHPSGDCNPSKDDKEITEKLIRTGEMLGIKVLDHVIVGKDTYWSWKKEN